MFHHFYGDTHPQSQGSISAEQLAQIIEHYKKVLVPAAEWAERARSGRLKDEVCLTFDDNLRCQFDIAYPILNDYHLTAFWFVSTAIFAAQPDLLEVYHRFRNKYFSNVEDFYRAFFAVADHQGELATFKPATYLPQYSFYTDDDRRFRYLRDEVLSVQEYNQAMSVLLTQYQVTVAELAVKLWMDEDQLRALKAAGHIVGLHSHTHPTNLKKLSVDEQRAEYEQNKTTLTKILGAEPTAVSHPCGSYDDDTLKILADLGISLGFRDTMTAGPSQLELPRQDHANIIKELRL